MHTHTHTRACTAARPDPHAALHFACLRPEASNNTHHTLDLTPEASTLESGTSALNISTLKPA
eukprot:2231098-Rhodomonas_salina.2